MRQGINPRPTSGSAGGSPASPRSATLSKGQQGATPPYPPISGNAPRLPLGYLSTTNNFTLASLLPLALALGALALYLKTAAPTITWQHGGSDGAELSAAALVLGVAHPPGYPLYLLLGHLFTYLPVGEVAFRVGLVSVLSASVGVGLVAYLAGRLAIHATALDRRSKTAAVVARGALPRHPFDDAIAHGVGLESLSQRGPAGEPPALPAVLAASGAGICLACAPLYWSQAVIQEVYSLHAALALGALFLLERWEPGKNHDMAALGLILGLGFTNHLTIALLATPAVIYIVTVNHKIPNQGVTDSPLGESVTPWSTRLLRCLPATLPLLLGLSLYLYLPLRAMVDPPLNWGDPSTLPRFIDHLTAEIYRGYFGGRPVGDVLARLPVVAKITIDQLTWPGLLLAFAGLGELARRRPAFFRVLLGYGLLTLLFALLYNAEGGEVYLLPLVPLLAVGLGLGVASLAQFRWGIPVAILLLIALPTWQLWTHAGAIDLSADRTAATYAHDTLKAAPSHGLLITGRDEHTFALWYLQIAEGFRPDVAVVDRRLLAMPWFREQLERHHPGLLSRLSP